MTVKIREALYLGSFADADADESSVSIEDGGVYTGTFGSSTAPLADNLLNVYFNDLNSDGVIQTNNDYNSLNKGEPISYDSGSKTVVTAIDSIGLVDLTITYKDGATASFKDAVMFQDAIGGLFLTNHFLKDSGFDLNSGSPIESIDVTSVSEVGSPGLNPNSHKRFDRDELGIAEIRDDEELDVKSIIIALERVYDRAEILTEQDAESLDTELLRDNLDLIKESLLSRKELPLSDYPISCGFTSPDFATQELTVTTQELIEIMYHSTQDMMRSVITQSLDKSAEAPPPPVTTAETVAALAKLGNNLSLLVNGVKTHGATVFVDILDASDSGLKDLFPYKKATDDLRKEMLYDLSVIERSLNLSKQVSAGFEGDSRDADIAKFALDLTKTVLEGAQSGITAHHKIIAANNFAEISEDFQFPEDSAVKVLVEKFKARVGDGSGGIKGPTTGSGEDEKGKKLINKGYEAELKSFEVEISEEMARLKLVAADLRDEAKYVYSKIKFIEEGGRPEYENELADLKIDLKNIRTALNDTYVDSEYAEKLKSQAEFSLESFKISANVEAGTDVAYRLVSIGSNIAEIVGNEINGTTDGYTIANATVTMVSDVADLAGSIAKLGGLKNLAGVTGGVSGVLGVVPGALNFANTIEQLANTPKDDPKWGYQFGEVMVQAVNFGLGAAIAVASVQAAVMGTAAAASAIPVLGALVSVVSAVNPMQWAAFDDQQSRIDTLRELSELDPLDENYESSAGELANLLGDFKEIDVGFYAASVASSTTGGLMTSALTASGVGAPFALLTTGITSGVQFLLQGMKQVALNNAANDVANRLREYNKDGYTGVEGFFERSFDNTQAKHLEGFLNTAKEIMNGDFDKVTAVGSYQMTKSDLSLAALTGVGGELAHTTSHKAAQLQKKDLGTDNPEWTSNEDVVDEISGTITYGNINESATGLNHYVKFITPLEAAGEENLVEEQVGKNSYYNTLTITDLKGWTLIDGGDNTAFDLKNVVTLARESKGSDLKPIHLKIRAGAGDDRFIMTDVTGQLSDQSEETMFQPTIDAGSGMDMATYGNLKHLETGLDVSISGSGHIVVSKRIGPNAPMLQGNIGVHEEQRGKETHKIEYRYTETDFLGKSQTLFDTFSGLELLAGSALGDTFRVSDYNEAFTVAAGKGDDYIALSQRHAALGGDGDDTFYAEGAIKTTGNTEADLPDVLEISGGEGYDKLYFDDNWAKKTFELGTLYAVSEVVFSRDSELRNKFLPDELWTEQGENIAVATFANLISKDGWAMTSFLGLDNTVEEVEWNLAIVDMALFGEDDNYAGLRPVVDIEEYDPAARAFLDRSIEGDYNGIITFNASDIQPYFLKDDNKSLFDIKDDTESLFDIIVGTNEFASNWSWGWKQHERRVADVNGDGRADIIGFHQHKTYVALGQTDGTFERAFVATNQYTQTVGGWGPEIYKREVADVNGDGRADIIGFGYGNTSVALGQKDGTFGQGFTATNDFAVVHGWGYSSLERRLADVNGDGRADIVAFGTDKTFVALGQKDGTFGQKFVATNQYTQTVGGWGPEIYKREVADVNGDGRADIVGFGYGNTSVALGQKDGTFGQGFTATNDFAVVHGWGYSSLERRLADVNGDGRADIVAFGTDKTFVALGKSDGTFGQKFTTIGNFAVAQGWGQEKHERRMADVNGDGHADIVGFGGKTYVGLLSDQIGYTLKGNSDQIGYTFKGNSERNGIIGTRHDDVIFGGAGDDLLVGHTGKDTLIGGEGNDLLYGGIKEAYFEFDIIVGTSEFVSNWSWGLEKHERRVADVNGDGRADIIGFHQDNTYVALGQIDGTFERAFVATKEFSHSTAPNLRYGSGVYWGDEGYKREVADVNGDGYADIIGFGHNYTSVALGQWDGTFKESVMATNWFSISTAWDHEVSERRVADVNGDGRADIVGFGHHTWVALGQSDGTFARMFLGTFEYSHLNGGWGPEIYKREVADVNGDGRADIIGFGYGNTSVALGQKDGTFGQGFTAINDFAVVHGWGDPTYERRMADVNGDGRADIVGFHENNTRVALGKSDGTFGQAFTTIGNFAVAQGWGPEKHERRMADVNGDGRADIVGFGGNSTFVGLSKNDVILRGDGETDHFEFNFEESTDENQVDIIADFVPGIDKIVLSGIEGWHELKVTDGTKGAEIAVSDNTIVLESVIANHVTDEDFIFA